MIKIPKIVSSLYFIYFIGNTLLIRFKVANSLGNNFISPQLKDPALMMPFMGTVFIAFPLPHLPAPIPLALSHMLSNYLLNSRPSL